MKTAMSFQRLCIERGSKFKAFVKLVFEMEYEQRPNYGELKQLLHQVILNEGSTHDRIYDWIPYEFKPAQIELKRSKSNFEGNIQKVTSQPWINE